MSVEKMPEESVSSFDKKIIELTILFYLASNHGERRDLTPEGRLIKAGGRRPLLGIGFLESAKLFA